MTTPRTLTEAWTVYRFGDVGGACSVYGPEGARRTAGRWNRAGDGVIYTSVHYSTGMLEKLVYLGGLMPANEHFVEVIIPAGTSYETFSAAHHPKWHAKNARDSRQFGHEWYVEQRSALLVVPSVVARMEKNVIINPAHPDAAIITTGLEAPVWWDDRLFA